MNSAFLRNSFQHLAHRRRDADRFSLIPHQHVPRVTLSGERARLIVDHVVIETDRGAFDLAHPDFHGHHIVKFDFPSIPRVRFHDWQKETHLLEHLVTESTCAAPRAARLLEPEEIVRVIGMPHRVRLAITDSYLFFGDVVHEWLTGYIADEM